LNGLKLLDIQFDPDFFLGEHQDVVIATEDERNVQKVERLQTRIILKEDGEKLNF
jgi:hypothetical protein